jgi:hypothetical protein
MAGSQMLALEPVPHFTASQALHNTATAAAAAVLLGVIVVAYRLARRHHSPVPFFFLLGGALTVGYEPVVDTLGKCYLPSDYQWTMFTVLDRPMPVYAVLVYTAFFGGFAIMSWNHLTTGGPAAGLWKKFAAAILVNTFLFETPAVSIFRVYTYYGHQPFDFWGFPLWWPFVNTAGPIAAGALIYVLGSHLKLKGRALFGLSMILIPMTDGAVNGAAAYPTWMALNSDVPAWITWCAGAITIGLAVLIMRGVIGGLEVVRQRDGRRPEGLAIPGLSSGRR